MYMTKQRDHLFQHISKNCHLMRGWLFGFKQNNRQGCDWLHDYSEESDEHPPVFEEDIVQYIVQEYVYDKAGGWTNERIRAYLDRQYLD